MSKLLHDEIAAKNRSINYEKEWYVATLSELKSIIIPNMRILDVCSGNCEFSEILREQFAAQVVCLDYSASNLQRARNLGFETIACNLDDAEQVSEVSLQYKNSFDIVVMLEAIEHIFAVDNVLSMIFTALKPEGRLFCSTPNVANIASRLYTNFCGNIPVAMGHHIMFFDERRLWQQLYLNGFDNPEITYFGTTGYYLDRTLVYNQHSPWRLRLIKALWWAGMKWGKKSLTKAGLLAICQKSSDSLPLGLAPYFREETFSNMTENEQINSLSRIISIDYTREFAEHPGLCAFIDTQRSRLHI